MVESSKNVAVLGATGSIGQNALEVIASSGGKLKATALSAHTKIDQLMQAARRHQPRWVAVTDPEASEADFSKLARGVELLRGPDALQRLVQQPEIDVVLAAIVGSAGLRSTLAAIEAGKTIALANKETLVMAGALVMELAAERAVSILPVDSEHSAIFQCLQAGRRHEVSRLVLTASGGPFRTYSREQLRDVTVEDALRHPTWDMGAKITVDSATMMNKALEIIEARWLFDVPAEQISVVVHPQSIVHSMVEYVDGACLAQLSPPDMKLPIQYALLYPERCGGSAPRLDWGEAFALDFEPPDVERFPALLLGAEAARRGGTTGAVLNAANEAAVAAFLEQKLRFDQIVPVCRQVLNNHDFDPRPTLDALVRIDGWARGEVTRWISA